MKVYVSEMPKGCESCPFYLKDHCVIDNISFYCPLEEGTIKVQSLADYTKQVRKEVCEEIRNKIKQAKLIYEWQGKEITIEDILEQIQGK